MLEDLEEILEILEKHRKITGDCMARTEDKNGVSYCGSMMLDCPYINVKGLAFAIRHSDKGDYLQKFYQCNYQPE